MIEDIRLPVNKNYGNNEQAVNKEYGNKLTSK